MEKRKNRAMDKKRKPFQGIANIIRFNWHFYATAIIFIALLSGISHYSNHSTSRTIAQFVSFFISISILFSLLVSYYVYDLSGFYHFDWIKNDDRKLSIINIHAGFDETSNLLKKKFKNSKITVLDFYNPNQHTEISIKRARSIYPPESNTVAINTSKINLENDSVDKIFVILSAHEIRNTNERIVFFKELHRILKPKGQIIVIEHLRDLSNFIAYNIGAFHFYSKSSWEKTFEKSNLKVKSEIKNTPFISTFTLKKNGVTI